MNGLDRQNMRKTAMVRMLPLLLAALAGLTLAGCGRDDGSAQPQAQASEPVQTAPKGESKGWFSGWRNAAPEPPRGPEGGQQVVQVLSERSVRDPQTDASAVASGQPPVHVTPQLAAQALDHPDERMRGRAVATVALQRSDDSTDLLLASATDPAPAVRRRAVEALWISAKDVPQRLPDIERALQDAARDSSPSIADLAQRALADIERQRNRR
jgi:hypothetical protein